MQSLYAGFILLGMFAITILTMKMIVTGTARVVFYLYQLINHKLRSTRRHPMSWVGSPDK